MLIQSWWSLVLRGLFGLVLGILALFLPGVTLYALVVLFGVYAIADGVIAFVAGVRLAGLHARWWPFLVEGLLGIGAGVIAFLWPQITAVALVLLIGAWAIATGILELIAAWRLRKHVKHDWLLALAGIVSIAFGVIAAINPGAGALAMVTVLGIYGLVFGSLLMGLGLSIRIRGIQGRTVATPV